MIVTEDFWNVVSQLTKPIYGLFFTGLLTIIIRLYENYYEKNNYIIFLKTNFLSIRLFIKRVQEFKLGTIVMSFVYFFLGVCLGLFIEYIFMLIIGSIFDGILSLDYVLKWLNAMARVENIEIIKLKLRILYSSCVNISFVILFFIYAKIGNIIISRNCLTPILKTDSVVSPLVMLVDMLYNIFIGIPVGMALILYGLLIINLQENKVIGENLSFIQLHSISIYDVLKTNVPYIDYHIAIHVIGLTIGLSIILDAYYKSNKISKDVVKAITVFYSCDFPYIKIVTGSQEIKGKLRDIKNKTFITLSENNVLKTVKWKKIDVMEVTNINKNDPLIFGQGRIS